MKWKSNGMEVASKSLTDAVKINNYCPDFQFKKKQISFDLSLLSYACDNSIEQSRVDHIEKGRALLNQQLIQSTKTKIDSHRTVIGKQDLTAERWHFLYESKHQFQCLL